MNKIFSRSKCEGCVSVSLHGGFGNQLFQLANGINLAVSLGRRITFTSNKSEFAFELNTLNVLENTFYTVTRNEDSLDFSEASECKQKKSFFNEESFEYRNIQIQSKHVILNGYFQSIMYFKNCEPNLSNWMRKHILKDSSQNYSQALTLHLRAGDYFKVGNIRAVHGVFSEDYVKAALETVKYKGEIICITDDPDSVTQAYPSIIPIVSRVISSSNYLEDFVTILTSPKIVISNSTFSWWAAYLSDAEVIGPKVWFANDLQAKFQPENFYPKNWIIL